jgi:centromere protein I
MCGILLQYHLAFQENSDRSEDWKATYTKEYVNIFNSIVMDVCNAIWRNRAFNNVDSHASGMTLPAYVVEQLNEICQSRNQNLGTALSITHSAALAGYSMRFMQVSSVKRMFFIGP